MRFDFCLINCLGDCNNESEISNNEKEAKRNVQIYNPKSKDRCELGLRIVSNNK